MLVIVYETKRETPSDASAHCRARHTCGSHAPDAALSTRRSMLAAQEEQETVSGAMHTQPRAEQN